MCYNRHTCQLLMLRNQEMEKKAGPAVGGMPSARNFKISQIETEAMFNNKRLMADATERNDVMAIYEMM